MGILSAIVQSFLGAVFDIRHDTARQLQRFVSIRDPIANLHNFPRHAISSTDYRTLRSEAMIAWREIAELNATA